MNEFKWTKKLLLFFIKDIFEGILSHDFFLPLIYIFFRQKYEKGNLNEILNILIKFYGDEASEINRNTTHGVLMIPHLILKAADVTSSKVILWGLSSTQYGSFRSSSSFSSCKQKTHTHTLTLFPSPTLLCSNVFAQWAKKPDRISNARRFDRESTVHRFILQYPLFIPPENPPDKIFDRSRVLKRRSNNYLTDRCCGRVEIVAPALGDQIELLTVLIQIPHGAFSWWKRGKMDCEVTPIDRVLLIPFDGRPSRRLSLISTTLDPLLPLPDEERERERERRTETDRSS